MRKNKPGRKSVMAVLGIIMITLGFAGLIHAQSSPSRQVIRLGLDGAYLGIEMEEVTADNMAKFHLSSETGVIVRAVEKGSPAEAARLQVNDVILEYAGVPVLSAATLSRLVQETPANRTVSLAVSREGKKINLSAKLALRRDGIAAVERGNLLINPDDVLGRLNSRPLGNGTFSFTIPRDGSRALGLISSGPRLGITVENLTAQMAEFLGVTGKKGVLVNNVNPGSPAAAVLKAGDVILALDQKPVTTPADLTQAMAKKEAGSKVEFRIVRDKKEITLSVDLPKSSASQGGIIL
jgi:serine protease Do